MMPGLWGAPLKGISAFIPPMGTQDFTGSSPNAINLKYDASLTVNNNAMSPKKYAGIMAMYEPDVVRKFGLVTYFDYDEALQVSRKLKKPLMLDFTGLR